MHSMINSVYLFTVRNYKVTIQQQPANTSQDNARKSCKLKIICIKSDQPAKRSKVFHGIYSA